MLDRRCGCPFAEGPTAGLKHDRYSFATLGGLIDHPPTIEYRPMRAICQNAMPHDGAWEGTALIHLVGSRQVMTGAGLTAEGCVCGG